MLTKETCEKIWHCHREIEAANNLLNEIEEVLKRAENHQDKTPKGIEDVFGTSRSHLELAVPSGDTSKRLFQVSYDLAVPVIKAHIRKKEEQLAHIHDVILLEELQK